MESQLGADPVSSSVWRAIHVKVRKSVAVKVFKAPFGGTPEAREQFVREWEQLKGLTHPAIVKCFGGGFEGTDAYLAHELIEGETLAEQLARTSRQPWEAVLELAQPLADALEYLHSQRILHGRIQPDKIMIAGLSPVLLDVRVDRFSTPYRTARPLLAHEMAMRAPELADNPNAITVQTDLYGLGATLYLALTGHPPIDGASIEEVRGNLAFQTPVAPATLVMDCPVWLDKLILQLLDKNPVARPPTATAVKAALSEVRRRAMSRSGVAEHASAGFSPLQVTNQEQRDEARTLLGRELISVAEKDDEEAPDATVWHDKTWVLLGGMFLVLALIGWAAWPDSAADLRRKAEALLDEGTRSALTQAKMHPLDRLIVRFPKSDDAQWAREQVDRIDVTLFLHQLSVKIKNNLAIKKQGELLHKQAQDYANIGDISKAIDKYRSIITVLGDEEEYRVAVNAAQYQIGVLKKSGDAESEAAKIVQKQLDLADQMMAENKVIQAREIWFSLIELYKDNSDLQPLIEKAQQRLQENRVGDE